MVENTNSTTLEVQGSFALTYMVGFIPLNLRSQEMDKGVPHARAAAAAGRAGRGRQAGRRAWCGCVNFWHSLTAYVCRVTLLLQLPTYGVTRRELADSWHNSARAGRLLARGSTIRFLGSVYATAQHLSLSSSLVLGVSISIG
jgi:hypothetical protein